MKTASLVVLLTFLVIVAGQPSYSDEREGIECGCDKVGQYNILSKGSTPGKVITSETEGTSQNGTYEYVTGSIGQQVVLKVRKVGESPYLVDESFTPTGNVGWGFSPDEHCFVYHFIDGMGHHYVRLFDLENSGTLINANGYGYITTDADFRFSPHGHYFFYAAIIDTDEVFLSLVDVSNPPYIVYDIELGLQLEPKEEIGLAAWGFNKKNSDASTDAAFMYGFKNFDSTYVTWRLIDLANLSEHQEATVISAAWWGFSPCGDVLGVIESDEKKVSLFNTINGSQLYAGGYSDTAAQLSVTLDEHLLNGQSLSSVVENTADSECELPLDEESPTWPEGAVLEASEITGTGMNLSWPTAEDNIGVSQYRIYVNGEADPSVTVSGGDTLSWDFTDLTSATAYTFAVEAGDAAGNWTTNRLSDTFETVDLPPYWPDDSHLDANDIGETSLTLSWTPAADDVAVTQYKIFISQYPDDIELGTVDAGEELRFEVTDLEVYTSYTFKVQAGDANANWSPEYLWGWARTMDLHAPIWAPGSELLASDVTSSSFTLNWDESDVSDNVGVQFYLLFLNEEFVDMLSTGENSYYLDCLTADMTFNFSLEASDPAGNVSNTGPELTITTASAEGECDGITTLVSVSSAGDQTYIWDSETGEYCNPYGPGAGGEGFACESAWSFGADISANGRYISFYSNAVNLDPADDNLYSDVFIHDRETGITELVSSDVYFPMSNEQWKDAVKTSISADGRYVAFIRSIREVYVKDRQTGKLHEIKGYDGLCYKSEISDNGRYVTFYTDEKLLFEEADNYVHDVFVYDLQTESLELVSISSDGQQAAKSPYVNSGSGRPSISADGRYIAFYSNGNNLVEGDNNTYQIWWSGLGWVDVPCSDILVRDRETNETTRVSVSSSGEQANESSYEPDISADGRYVAFISKASNLVPDDTNDKRDVFVHDRQTGKTRRVNVSSTGQQANDNTQSYSVNISADGRFVTFASSASNLVPDDNNGVTDIFVHDCLSKRTKRVNLCSCGTEANSSSNIPTISDDGTLVAFHSDASNLLANLGDANRQTDIFVHKIQDIDAAPGDFNDDGEVDLADAILALKVTAKIPSTTVSDEAEVSGDQKIGIEEVIYVLQKVSGLK